MLIRVNKVNFVIHPILSTNSETAKQFFEQKYQGGAASQSKIHHSRVSSSGGNDLFLLHDDRLPLSRTLVKLIRLWDFVIAVWSILFIFAAHSLV